MEKQRRGEAERIDPIHDAAVTRDGCAPILCAQVALDGRHDKPAEEPREADEQSHKSRLPHVKRRRKTHPHCEQNRR